MIDRNVLPKFMLCLEAFVFGRGYAYRYGGDEYAILLPGVGQQAAKDALEGLRLQVQSLRYPGISTSMTISVGMCVVEPDCYLTNFEVEHNAERAKNVAKEEGRNQIAVFSVSHLGAAINVVRGPEESG